MHGKTILVGTVLLALFCSLGLQAQQSDSNAPNNTNPSASSQPTGGTVPRLIKFSGVVKDLSGKVPTGTVGLTFSLYELPEGGSPLWVETQSAQLDAAGHYTVLVGASSPSGLPLDLFTTGKALWLGVQPQLPGQGEQPRALLVSVPYALKAGDAETLGGKPASAYLLAQPNEASAPAKSQTGSATDAGNTRAPLLYGPILGVPMPQLSGTGTTNYLAKWQDPNTLTTSIMYDTGTSVGIGTTAPGTVNGTPFPSLLFQASQPGASTYLTANTDLPGGYAGLLLNRGAASANNHMWVVDNQPDANNTSSRLAFSTYNDAGMATPMLAILRSGNVGIGTTAPVARLEVNGTAQFDGLVTFAPSQPFPGGGVTSISAGPGLTATPTNPITTSGTLSVDHGTVAFLTDVTNAVSTAEGYANSTFLPLTGGTLSGPLQGTSATFSGLLQGNGGATFNAPDSSHFGMKAIGATVSGAGSALNGAASAIGGSNSSPSGLAESGLVGYGGNATGTNGFGGIGLGGAGGSGNGSGGTGGPGGNFWGGYGSNLGGDGVYAQFGVGATYGHAGNFAGNLNVTGAITAGTKDFLIDHPLDPANQYLYHASVESSEMKTIYDGTVTLDATGEAVVELPNWFQSLNTNFRYQLTAIGAPGPNLYIAEEVSNNHFKIAGGQPGMKVSWLVTGVRQDRFAKAHPLQVEVQKPERERGYYIHPELYGAPEEKQIEWARHPQLMQRVKEERAKLAQATKPEPK